MTKTLRREALTGLVRELNLSAQHTAKAGGGRRQPVGKFEQKISLSSIPCYVFNILLPSFSFRGDHATSPDTSHWSSATSIYS